jgi:hypothetical protein
MIEYMNTRDRRAIQARIRHLRLKVEGKEFNHYHAAYEELLSLKKLVRIANHNGQWKDETVTDLVATDSEATTEPLKSAINHHRKDNNA